MDSNKTLKIGLALAAVVLLVSPETAGLVLVSLVNIVHTGLRGVSISFLITMICYLGALVFFILGAVKWKDYRKQPDLTPFKIPVTYWGIAVMLAVYPEFMSGSTPGIFPSTAHSLIEGEGP